ncbi:MAG TPA: RNase adapter RapZ [Candidatus Eubacterium faecipullorum]|uniref:RNase adapter RapZ n=1 Tax=Candidatus Eubacterium faecipullorum TaxID=2838571 RepID=A0A9D1RE23_9FIRM|nr:RNase adapter RapZ [Candidatus Eubacterium faecipullorum]
MTKTIKELVIITGLSGAGKSTAIGFMEDIGYYCIDNMPPELLTTFLDLISKQKDGKIAIVMDIRSTEKFDGVLDTLDHLEDYGYSVKVIYLDIKTHIALKRYKLTRRKHPYAERFNGDIAKALAYEKEIMTPLRSRADFIIDSSDLTGNQLRTRLTQILVGDDKDIMNIHVESFGFKHGIPNEADFVIDVRCLPNPYWVENLRNKTGLDQEVRDYVFSFAESKELLEKLIDLLDFLNPLYIKEGKSQIVFAIGCTGGNHRSVAIAEALKEHFEKKWDNVSVNHRDISRS